MLVDIYLIGIVPAWFYAAGMVFSDFQFGYPEIARKHRRKDAGFSVMFGAFCGIFWPAGLWIAYCLSGFAEHGIWRSPKC